MTTRRERYAAAEEQGREGALCGYDRHNNPYHIVREAGMYEAWLRGLALASVDTLPKGQDAKQGLAGKSGAVPHEDAADAHTAPDTSHKRMGE